MLVFTPAVLTSIIGEKRFDFSIVLIEERQDEIIERVNGCDGYF